MKGNTYKCHLIVGKNNAQEFQAGKSFMKTCNCENLLGIKIDHKLTFDDHATKLCKKAYNKMKVLDRATPFVFVNIEKEKLLMNSSFNT